MSARESSCPDQKGDADQNKQEQEDYLDEALQETFPASDPIAPGRVERDYVAVRKPRT